MQITGGATRSTVSVPWPRVVLLLAALACVGCEPADQPDVLRITGVTMGTQYVVKIAHPPQGMAPAELRRVINGRLEQLNAVFSTYDPSSELSLFNEQQSVQWVDISRELAAVLSEAVLAGRQSGGAFDPTVGPVVNLWSFGPRLEQPGHEKTYEVPSDEAIAAARRQSGLEQLEVQSDPPAARKKVPELYVDLSGIAKGYAVDELSRMLAEMGMENHMIDIGGEVKAVGSRPDGQPWRIGIEVPRPSAETDLPAMPRVAYRVIELTDTAMATSGNYRNFFTSGGERYGHIIDPRTGRPAKTGVVSATVIDPSCMRADAMATAMMVLGVEEGMKLAEEQDSAVLLVADEDARPEGWQPSSRSGSATAPAGQTPGDAIARASIAGAGLPDGLCEYLSPRFEELLRGGRADEESPPSVSRTHAAADDPSNPPSPAHSADVPDEQDPNVPQ